MIRLWLVMALVAVLASPAFADGANRTYLRDRAQVRGQRIFLSDLLVSADAHMLEKAAAIELGRAPQPGSARIFYRDQVARRLSPEPEFRQIPIPSQIMITNPGWEIERHTLWNAVATYLREHGSTEEKQLAGLRDLHWPEGLITAEKSPRLEVTAMNVSKEDLQIRIRCVSADRCGSFLISMETPDSVNKLHLPSLELQRVPVRPFPHVHRRMRAAIVTPAGKRVILVLQNGGMRISVPVVTLQAGALGQRIRAREWHGRHVYEGDVAGPGLLKAAL